MHANHELIKLWANHEKRHDFFHRYQKWGVWFTVEQLGYTYFKHDLPDGKTIIAMEYQTAVWGEQELKVRCLFYLHEGGLYSPTPSSDWQICDHLKQLKIKLQQEAKGGSTDGA